MIRRAAVVVGALAFIACGSDAAPRSDAASSSAPPTTTAPTTTPETVPLSPAESAQVAATTFVNAWRDGNRLAALTIALPAAVDAVFAAGEPGSLENRGCNRPPMDSPVYCVYRTTIGELQVRAQPGPDGWIVDQAILSDA